MKLVEGVERDEDLAKGEKEAHAAKANVDGQHIRREQGEVGVEEAGHHRKNRKKLRGVRVLVAVGPPAQV